MQKINFKDDQDLFGRLYTFTAYPEFLNLRNAVEHHNVDLNDCFSWGQLKSKRWLIDTCESLKIDLGAIFLCGGWYALLASMLFRSKCQIDTISSFDIDPDCAEIAETINRTEVKDNWRFKASTLDIINLEYDDFHFPTCRSDGSIVTINRTADTIINTSCEHIEKWELWWNTVPKNKLVILQSNNFHDHPNHCNTQKSLDNWLENLQLSSLYFADTLNLDNYKRYMVIGKR